MSSSPGSRAVGPPPHPGLLSLYDQTLPEVYGYLLARCGSRPVAEDLTAETFLAAVRAHLDGRGPLSAAWLIGTARHKLVDHWRAAERENRGLAEVASENLTDPWDAHLDALLAQEVLAEQSGLHRAVLTLRYLDGLPVGEVAHALGRTRRATDALLGRARAAFRRSYEGRTR